MAFKGLRFAGLEWKNITASKVMWVVIAAIAIMPLLYGALYLAAFQDPYARLNTVPVAVVNEDEGAVIAGENRNLGDDVVDELKGTDDGLGWNFVSADEAQKGLEDGAYFMTCTIPADFSESVSSVDSSAPEKAQLNIEYNQSENMLASQIGETVWKEVRQRVSDSVAAEYWTTVLDRVADSGKDIQTAADGAGTLKDGLVTAQDGSQTITANLGTLADGATALDSGLGALESGAFTLRQGTLSLASGANQLKAGAGQVAGGAGSVASGAAQLKSEGTSALAAGAGELKDQTATLPDQASQMASGSSQITSGLATAAASIGSSDVPGQTLAYTSNTVTSGLGTLGAQLGSAQTGAAAVNGGLVGMKSGLSMAQVGAQGYEQALVTAIPAMQNSTDPATKSLGDQLAASVLEQAQSGAVSNGLDGALASLGDDASPLTLIGGSKAVAVGLSEAVNSIGDAGTPGNTLAYGSASVTGGLETLGSSLAVAQAGSQKITDGAGQLAASAPKLVDGVQKLDAGANQVNGKMSELASGASQVADGASQVDAGASSAVSGANQLNDGAAQLVSGAASAKDGSAQIASGAGQLKDGSAALTSGLTDAVDGSGELSARLAEGARTAADQTSNIAGKSEVMSDPVELVNEYYTTVKNYGTGFAPYFMALGLWVGGLVAGFVFKPLNNRLIMSGGSPLTVAFANYLPVAFFSLIQATLLMVVLQFGLQLQIDNVPAFYAMGYLTALVFAAIMQMLMAAFGFPGKFVAIILLMLQLTACAGTFPIQTTPDFFQVINPYMPMTYVVQGMRQIMTGLDYGIVGFDCFVLFAIGAVCFALTCLVAWRKRTVRMDDLHPVLQLG
ncbi:YhgE/Pip domain-containing protein [Gordonibacter sp. 28C]|uniref:YhgE/Pip domain-containing protein n=1 Tax=Gordonibacter sp. 28C TaxID=2078569 RepID=UPI000DF8230E|nr:YhgE/Pip domain-containing protein [Gordonibacter sp. 28C]RDB63382.1 YhgE/Pip domain-containing protein [Gordonibacter sp. 28C]